jgi:hypothetical protein
MIATEPKSSALLKAYAIALPINTGPLMARLVFGILSNHLYCVKGCGNPKPFENPSAALPSA